MTKNTLYKNRFYFPYIQSAIRIPKSAIFFAPVLQVLYFLTFRAYMGAPLSNNDPFDVGLTAGAGLTGAAKHLQFILVAAAMASHRVKIGFTGAQGCPQIFQAALKHFRNGPAQRLDFVHGQGCG